MAEIRPQPQSPALGALARMLGAARDAAGRVRIDSQLLGQTSLADLLSLPGAAGLAEDVSYFGPAAMLRPGSGRTLQTFKLDPRVLDAADVALNVSPLGALAARGAARAARPVARAAGEAVNRAMLTGEGPLASALAPVAPLSVVKPKGGNWPSGTIESAVEPLKRKVEGEVVTPEMAKEHWDVASVDLFPDAAINRWLDKKLAGYLRNEMATPEDPLRLLIQERGISHLPEETLLEAQAIEPMSVGRAREAAGFPEEGFAHRAHAERGWPMGAEEDRTRMAEGWEALSDNAIRAQTAGRLISPEYEHPVYGKGDAVVAEFLSRDPWLAKVPPETPVYSIGSMSADDLDFRHLVDELSNALDPATDLPRELRYTPKDIERVTVPQAVERVAQINAWRAEQKTAADLARANNAASVEYRAYPTVPGTDRPNEKGLRWVELKQPAELPEGWELGQSSAFGEPTYRKVGSTEASLEHPGRSFLEAALKYEGDTMGHCVGRYCPDVASGRSRVFSLRDAKGEPHVTVEVSPRTSYGTEHLRAQRPQAEREAAERGLDPESSAYSDFIGGRVEELARENLPLDIIQIKGKVNLAPKEDYLPFVQDFVRSGQWGRVGDPQNAGLRLYTDVFNDNEQRAIEALGESVPDHLYLTGSEIQRLHNLIVPEGQRLKYDARGKIVGDERQQGFARGGAVNAQTGPAQYDPADIARRAATLMEEFDARLA
jgi:hypothetical protein